MERGRGKHERSCRAELTWVEEQQLINRQPALTSGLDVHAQSAQTARLLSRQTACCRYAHDQLPP